MTGTSSKKEAAGRTVWPLLLGGLSLLVLVSALFIGGMAVGDRPSPAETPGPSIASSAAGSSLDATKPGTAEGDEAGLAQGEDGLEEGTEAACGQFRSGATVADFAVWFEAEMGSVGPEEAELFQAILVEALTRACPEVIPGG